MIAQATSSAAIFDPVFDAQTAFRVLLDSMARPGQISSLGVDDPRCPVPACGALAAVARTLIDHEVGFAVVAEQGGDAAATGELARYLTLATGSRPVAAPEANFIFSLGTPPAGLLSGFRRGLPAFPDEGATVIVLVPALDAAADGLAVALQGPGVPPDTGATLVGLTAETLAERDAANAEPPCGIDLVLIDEAGRILCLPRSTKVRLS